MDRIQRKLKLNVQKEGQSPINLTKEENYSELRKRPLNY